MSRIVFNFGWFCLPPPRSSLFERLCHNRGLVGHVILSPLLVILSETKDLDFWLRVNSAKNLIISTESTREILRLSPQNDTMTQSRRGKELLGKIQIFCQPFTEPSVRPRTMCFWTNRIITSTGRVTMVAAALRPPQSICVYEIKEKTATGRAASAGSTARERTGSCSMKR